MAGNTLASHFVRAYQDLLTAESEHPPGTKVRKSLTLENKLCMYELKPPEGRKKTENGLIIKPEVESPGSHWSRPSRRM